jgi:hypothetical protein
MKSTDLQAVHDATNALLGSLDPKFDRLALAYTGQSLNATTCGAGALGAPAPKGTASGGYTWIVAPYPNVAPLTDYQDPTSPIAKSVACITTAQFNSSVGTDLGNPVAAAASYLNGLDDGAQKDIILMTDGAANVSPSGQQPCAFANSTATSAKNAGITVVTIGFGVGDKSVADDTCTDSSGAYVGAPATTLLANMATTSVDNGCTDAENSDGDNFFCEPKNSGDLSSVFVEAAASLTGDGTRLVK